jgi:hypothetical protein
MTFRVVASQVVRRSWRVIRQPLKHARVAAPSARSNANGVDESERCAACVATSTLVAARRFRARRAARRSDEQRIASATRRTRRSPRARGRGRVGRRKLERRARRRGSDVCRRVMRERMSQPHVTDAGRGAGRVPRQRLRVGAAHLGVVAIAHPPAGRRRPFPRRIDGELRAASQSRSSTSTGFPAQPFRSTRTHGRTPLRLSFSLALTSP